MRLTAIITSVNMTFHSALCARNGLCMARFSVRASCLKPCTHAVRINQAPAMKGLFQPGPVSVPTRRTCSDLPLPRKVVEMPGLATGALSRSAVSFSFPGKSPVQMNPAPQIEK